MPQHHHRAGRQEFGQNFLVDRKVINLICSSVSRRDLPVVELGGGSGALTRALAKHSSRVTAIEVDPRRASQLRRSVPRKVRVVEADFLDFRFGSRPSVVVGNIPFHLTTATLRWLLPVAAWPEAVLLMQWEAARRRAGVGGSSLLTASWSPWFEFELLSRVPARSFRPVPSVDGGLLRIVRRDAPLVPPSDRSRYQRFVGSVFNGGAGIGRQVIAGRHLTRNQLRRWTADSGVARNTPPSRLEPEDWGNLWTTVKRFSTG